MTAIELSKIINKTKSAISEYESGNSSPRLNVLAEIARLFKVSLDDLVFRDLSTLEMNSLNELGQKVFNTKLGALLDNKIELIENELTELKKRIEGIENERQQ